MARPVVGYALVSIFSVLLLAVGIYSARGNRLADFDDFAVAGRSVGLGLGTGTLLASWVTASTIIAAPQIAYQLGYLGAIGYAMGGVGLVLYAPIAKRIRRMLPRGVTVTDFLIERYDEKNYWLFLFFFFTLIFLNSAQLPIGAGTMLSVVFGINYHVAVLITTIPILAYIIVGGMRSVIATDYIQVLGIVALLLVFIPLILLTKSPEAIVSGMEQARPAAVRLTAPEGVLWAISAVFFLFGLVLMLNSFWQRVYSISEDKLTQSFAIAGLSWAAIPMLTGIFGFVGLSIGITPENINQVAPLVIETLFPPIVATTFVLLVFLAFASSLDTRVNSMAVMAVHELYYKHFDPEASTGRKVRMARLATVVFGVVVLAIGWKQPGMIDIIVVMAPINAAYVPPFVLGAFWDKTNTDAVFVGTISACLFAVYATLGPFFGMWAAPDLPINTRYVATLICFGISLSIIVGGSLLYPEGYEFENMTSFGQTAREGADD